VNYENYEGFESRAELSFPHLPPNQWYMIDLFPSISTCAARLCVAMS